jgi:hypothetical protein
MLAEHDRRLTPSRDPERGSSSMRRIRGGLSMSVDRLEVKVSLTKLLLALIIVIVPLSIIGLVLTQRSDRALDNAVGSNFKTMAQLYAAEVTQSMRDRVSDVSALANDPAVVQAVAGNSKASAGGALDANASQVLRQRKILDPRFLSIVVTNDSGQVVAASQHPAKASYAQDADWHAVFNNGQGATKVGDIVDDEFTKSYYVTIGVPVADQRTGQAIGVVSAAVNVSDMLARFREGTVGTGARAALVNEDGNIVSAPNADVFARLKSQEFDFVRDSLGSVKGSQNGWVMADVNGAQRIVGFAGTGLKQHFANLGWVVTVSQDEHQAAAPIRPLGRFALIMVVLAVFMLTLLCVYYYLHRAQRYHYIEDEMAAAADHARAATV